MLALHGGVRWRAHAGALTLRRHYLEEPNPDQLELDNEGLRQDFERMPRTAYWTPAWLRERL
jgi:hypothetical protein